MAWRAAVLPREHGLWGYAASAGLLGLLLSSDLSGALLLPAPLAAAALRQAGIASAREAGGMVRMLVALLALAILAASAWTTHTLVPDRPWPVWAIAAAIGGIVAGLPIPRRPWWFSALAAWPAACFAAAVATAGGATATAAAGAALALGLHLAAMVPLVRARTRGHHPWAGLAIEAHLVAVLVLSAAAGLAWVAPALPLLALLSLARCAWILWRPASRPSPARIGRGELAWSGVVALGIAWGTA